MVHFPSDFVSLKDAAKLLPGRPHISTIHRWRTRGVRGVRLATVKVGGRHFVSRAELQRFVNASSDHPTYEPPPEAASHAERAEAAGRELEQVGILKKLQNKD